MGRITSHGADAPSGGGIVSLNGLVASSQTFATGTTGTDFNIASAGSTHTFNIPDASVSARGLVTTGTQSFAGDKTFEGNVRFNADVLIEEQGGTDAATIQVAALAAARTYTIPDAGAAASFVMTAGTQTIGGSKTFSTAPTLSSVTASRVLTTDGSSVITASTVTTTTLAFLDATSSIQTQLDKKEFSLIGAISGVGGTAVSNCSYGITAGTAAPSMARAGVITAISISLTSARTAGTCNARVTINGTAQTGAGQTVDIDGTNTQDFFLVLATPIAYAAGDIIGLQTSTTGFTPAGASATMVFWARPT